MKKRIITSIILLAILFPLVFVENLLPVFELFAIIFVIIASCEMLNMFEKEHHMPLPIKIIVIFSTLLLYFAIISNNPLCSNTYLVYVLDYLGFKLNIIICLGVIFILNLSCLVIIPSFSAQDIGRSFLSIIYVAIGFAALATLRFLGMRFIVYLLLIALGTDIFALVWGLTLGKHGKHKLAPNISPKKSWEGAIGGTATMLVIGLVFVFTYNNISAIMPGVEAKNFFDGILDTSNFPPFLLGIFTFFMTLCMSICGQIGDLVASKLKRGYEIKDFSNIFPGHGGMLDRFDSSIYAAVVFLIFLVIAMNYVPVAA
jgi:phosphatidate cytidylyltransferase